MDSSVVTTSPGTTPRLHHRHHEIDLSRNQFSEFPEEHQLLSSAQCRTNTFSLQLHHNDIGFLPPIIGSFTSLVILDVSNNNLSHIAEEISALHSLETLVAKNNCLDNDSLPKTFDQLHSLSAVNFGGNNFTEFPPQLVHLPKVNTLLLGSNKIRMVPDTIDQMQR